MRRVSGRLLAWLSAFVVAVPSAAALTAQAPAAAAARPRLTIHAHYVPRDHNIAFAGIALPGGTAMLTMLEFRLEEKESGRWVPISAWMALITGVGARWQVNGHYSSQLMAMNEPVPAGTLRVQMHIEDSAGGQAAAESNAVVVR